MDKNLKKLDKLIDLTLEDDDLTEKEMTVLLNKAKSLGIDEGEAEIYIDTLKYRHDKKKEEINESESSDMFQITNEELTIRCIKWVNLAVKTTCR